MSTHLHTFYDGEPKIDTALPFMSENEAEVARQLLLHRRMSEILGGVVPSAVNFAEVRRVLDVGCGVGAWVQEVAERYAEVEVIGVDRSAYLIEQGRELLGNSRNTRLLVEDIHALLEMFEEGSFDVVHVRFLVGEVAFEDFPVLVRSLVRLCRAGGWLVWTEAELPRTNSQACDCLESMVLSGLLRAGRAFGPGYSLQLGIFNWMDCWMREAGCALIQNDERVVDVSAGTGMHRVFAQQAWAFGHQVRRFLLEMEVVPVSFFEEVLAEMQEEVRAEVFRGFCPVYTVVGARS